MFKSSLQIPSQNYIEQMGNNPQQVDKFNKQTDKRFFIFPSKPVYSLFMVSLNGAGKTTLLYNLVLGQVPPTIPTIGFNVERVHFEKNILQFWDVGGGIKTRQLWKHYLQMMKGIIYVIDLSDSDRLEEALDLLENLLSQQGCKGKYLFIIGTKKEIVQPRHTAQLERRVKQMNMSLRYRLRYVSGLNTEEVGTMFKEISEICAIV